MSGWIVLAIAGAAVAIPVLVKRLADRYDDEIDSYFEREQQDPLALGGGTFPGAGGGPA